MQRNDPGRAWVPNLGFIRMATGVRLGNHARAAWRNAALLLLHIAAQKCAYQGPVSASQKSAGVNRRLVPVCSSEVPELTRGADIQVNERVWLRRPPHALSRPHPDIAPKVRTIPGKAVRRSYSAWRLCFEEEAPTGCKPRVQNCLRNL